MNSHSKSFNFLYDIHDLQTWDSGNLKTSCMTLETVLSDGDECDINGMELNDEVLILAPMLSAGSSPQCALSYITKSNFIDIFPNTFVSLRILLTLPVSVASGERSFSKLKLIKTYLRSTLSQERLCGLSTLAIESDTLKSVDSDTILKEFAKLKARKISL